MDKIKLIAKYVEKHTDNQSGLDVSNINIFSKHDRVVIIVSAKKLPGSTEKPKLKTEKRQTKMSSEWKAQAHNLINELSRDPGSGSGFGIKFRLIGISDTYFMLEEKL